MTPRPSLLPYFFLLCALPVLMFLASAVPTGEIPDEVAHIVRMEGLLHLSIVGHRGTRLDGAGNTVPDSGVDANAGLLAAGFTFTPGDPLAKRVLSRERFVALEALQWEDHAEFVSVPNTAVYSPLFYVPGALGMAVGKALGIGPWGSILAARAANVAAYVLCGFLALRLARRMQGLLFATLVLPMSLWLGASCNQDGIVIAVATLAAALLTRGTLAGWWTAAAALATVAMAKPLYLPLVGVVAVLLPARGASVPLRAAGVLLASVPALAWFAISKHFALVPFVRGGPFQAGPYWPGEPEQVFTVVDAGLQLQVLLHRPALFFTLPIRTAIAQGPWLVRETIGLLGVLDLILPLWVYGLWLIALAALLVGESLAGRRDVPGPGGLACIAGLACVAVTVLALFDGQYLSWTLTGADEIQGMQGRYFIPLIPFIAVALPRWRLTSERPALRTLLRLPAMLAGVAGLAVIPALVLTTYYLR